MKDFASIVAAKLSIPEKQVTAALELLDEGATIPFIARYRKDKTGALDEVQIGQIQDESKALKTFTERKTAIEKSITEQGKMNDSLQGRLDHATTLAELEDIYLPHKPKRKTKAQAAREKGLEPLALLIMEQKPLDLPATAQSFISSEIKTVDEALQGARDIIAEIVNEHETVRTRMRKFFAESASLESKVLSGKETDAVKYRDYFDYSEKISKIPSHRILAVLRGFMEGFLRMSIAPPEEEALEMIAGIWSIARGTSRLDLAGQGEGEAGAPPVDHGGEKDA